ncbi:MAG: hypothetical protein Q9181_005264 [Wetmoreana brouardii]
MRFLDPQGHNFVGYNLDGWGILQLVFAVLFTLVILVLSAALWKVRNDPVIRMRKPTLSIAAANMLHVYTIVVLIVYPLNEHWPCGVEFWVMSLYLPIGIGLFQASNQVLLLVSRGQQSLLNGDIYKPLPSGNTAREYYWNAFALWCKAAREQEIFEGFVAAGIVLQFLVSLVIYVISRQFNAYGVVSHPATEAMCRRGWEWAPSIIWQAVWNYIAGPYLLWKIRMIRDVYHWRLQTTLAVIAGLPGTPLWLAAVYSDKLNSINKYWNPAMWFVPGLITMELACLLGPLLTCRKNRKQAKEQKRALREFADKKAGGDPAPNDSLTTLSTKTDSSRGLMFNMQSLEDCLDANGPELTAFHDFCATKLMNAENIVFLEKAIKFKNEWTRVFNDPSISAEKALKDMFRIAVTQIYLIVIDKRTAAFCLNIGDKISIKLKALFGEAADAVASYRPSTPRSLTSEVTPWEDHADPFTAPGNDHPLRPILRRSIDKGSSTTELITARDAPVDPNDPLSNIAIPEDFDENCWDEAMPHIKNLLWQSPWQSYMRFKRESDASAS